MPAQYNPYRRPFAPETKPVPAQLTLLIDHDSKEFDAILEEHHYLGARCQAGDYLRLRVFSNGDLVALLAFGPCSYALKDRDRHIGWNNRVRAERQKLVVQNRRFLLLPGKGERPNLASQILGAVARKLPTFWEKCFGYQPLALETFTEIEAYHGTCYKAAGWEALGKTKGFSRHRSDVFDDSGKPKKLWFKPLRPQAIELLRGEKLPPECTPGATSSGHGVMPVNQDQIISLYDCLRRFPDPRRHNTTFKQAAVLSIVVMAQMCGRTTISDIVRFGQSLTQAQRRELGLPRKKKGENFRKVPAYNAYRNLLGQVDPEKLAAHLSEWLQSQNGRLPGTVALDGKMFKNISGVITLAEAETGLPTGMAPMRHKKKKGSGELTCGRHALRSAGDLSGRTVSGDALHADKTTARQILEQGGEYMLQVKTNQPTLHKHVKRVTKNAPLFSENRNGDMGGM